MAETTTTAVTANHTHEHAETVGHRGDFQVCTCGAMREAEYGAAPPKGASPPGPEFLGWTPWQHKVPPVKLDEAAVDPVSGRTLYGTRALAHEHTAHIKTRDEQTCECGMQREKEYTRPGRLHLRERGTTMTYACILVDPPWPETGGGGRGAQNHYDVESYADIPRVVLASPEWRPARVFWLGIWTTKSSLPHAFALLAACGTEYITTWTWVKESAQGNIRMGMGQYGRHGVEFILWGRRGMPGKLPTSTKVQADFSAPVGEHSEKPSVAYESAASVFPGPRLEMFARGPRAGWDVHGNEAQR